MFFKETPLMEVVSFECSKGKQPVFIRKNTLDEYIYKEIFSEKQYKIKPNDIKKFKHLSHFDTFYPTTILDLGANIGLSSIFFSIEYPNATIYSVEPDEENYDLLKRNTLLFENIRCINGAIWSKNEVLYIANRNETVTRTGKYNKASYYVQLDKVNNESPVKGFTISHLMEKRNIKTIDICKIDIQGAEKEIFESNAEWLNDVKCLFVEVHDRYVDGCFFAVSKAMEKYGFIYISSSGRDGNVHLFVKREE